MMRLSTATPTFPFLFSFIAIATAQTYNVVNNCPDEINFYNRGQFQRSLSYNESFTQQGGNKTGFYYTNYNGGQPNGDNTTRFGTYAYDNNSYFFVVKGAPFNTGFSVETTGGSNTSGGFCPTIVCDASNCNTAFDVAPVAPAGFPPITTSAPTPPLYSCPGANVNYKVTFCPNGKFPNEITGRPIHPVGYDNKCLDVRGAVFENGTPVQIYDCNGSQAQKWVIDRGTTKVRVAGTNFCLDRGETPGNGVGLKIWQCYIYQPPQTWVYNDVNRITSAGLCVDLTNGVTTNANQVQTWECSVDNNNQFWIT